jgi:hypothetical protein
MTAGWGDCGLGGRAADDDWDDGNGHGGGRDCCCCWEGGNGGDGMTGSEENWVMRKGFKPV